MDAVLARVMHHLLCVQALPTCSCTAVGDTTAPLRDPKLYISRIYLSVYVYVCMYVCIYIYIYIIVDAFVLILC